MQCPSKFIGCNDVDRLKSVNHRFSFTVCDQVNDSQELVQVNDFARETNEYQYKSKVQERIADINSWRWVLEDLSKRLQDTHLALKHEHKALRVVIERLEEEINDFSRDKTRPGILAPQIDLVEEAILMENQFLREQKKTFESMIVSLEKRINTLERIQKRIEDDVLKKAETITIEEACANSDIHSVVGNVLRQRKKKKASSIGRWECKCAALKNVGLKALYNAHVARQQARGARVQLSIAAQTFSSRVDLALRKRLHHNTSELKELEWQREEAARDKESLDQEQLSTEKSLIQNMEYERLMIARLGDRSLRPKGEHTKDEVDKKLRDELARLRLFIKSLRDNLDRITKLKNNLVSNIDKIECCARDLIPIIRLDQERWSGRRGEDIHVATSTNMTPTSSDSTLLPKSSSTSSSTSLPRGQIQSNATSYLVTIKEEEEECEAMGGSDDEDDGVDDYPFDY